MAIVFGSNAKLLMSTWIVFAPGRVVVVLAGDFVVVVFSARVVVSFRRVVDGPVSGTDECAVLDTLDKAFVSFPVESLVLAHPENSMAPNVNKAIKVIEFFIKSHNIII
jgi:hypothetical protein